MKKLDHILKFILDVVVIVAITILAYFDKVPREVIVGVLGMYAGAYAQQRRNHNGPKDGDGKGGTGSASSSGGMVPGATMLFGGVLLSMLSMKFWNAQSA